MEAEVYSNNGLAGANAVITDIDVLALVPNPYSKMEMILGDCKTLKSQSPITRVFWMSGLINWMDASKGFVLLSKEIKQVDHKLVASQINVNLLSEKDFEIYARATSSNYQIVESATLSIDVWDNYYGLAKRFPNLKPFIDYVKNGFWNTKDFRAQLRHSLLKLRELKSELNPVYDIQVALFADMIALFSIALSHAVIEIFNQYLMPESKELLSQDLKVVVWGGSENYTYYNSLYTYVKHSNEADLTLPEWDTFVQLVRQCLEKPFSVSNVALIMREVAFEFMNPPSPEQGKWSYSSTLAKKDLQAAKFALLITEYICKATKVPSDIKEILVNRLMKIQY